MNSKPSLVRKSIDLVKLLESTRQLVQRSLSIDIVLDIEPPPAGELWMALVDANQVQQVLVNLSLNARDAMPKPQPAPIVFRLRHRVYAGEFPAFPQNVPPGDYVMLEVEDQGAGMPADVLAQALDPFFTTKEVGQGTGLGLPVAFGIMNGHHGCLTLTSELGVGTRVSLFLPRLLNPIIDPSADNVTVLEPEVSLCRRILVIDDEPAVQDVICRFLEIAGHVPLRAANARDGIHLLASQKVDLLVLDWMIPHEDCRDSFHQLRAVSPGIPVLLCTGLLQTDQATELLREGAVDLLRKPFRMNELWYAVDHIFHDGDNVAS